jgi:FdhD protein
MPPHDGAASVEFEARRFAYDSGGAGTAVARVIAVEAPIEFVIGGSPFVVMMATPQDLEDFAYGFLFTEGIVERPEDIREVEIEGVEGGGWRLGVTLAGERLKAHLARKRAISGRTGCGLCGLEDLGQLQRLQPKPLPEHPVEPAAIGAALAELEARQPLNALTRAVHAAAWCGVDGRILLVREDVGRHNALDKAIGALWRAGIRGDRGFLVVTSRCSFELVTKAAIFGAQTLVSLSAPTSLALERAREYGIAVIAIARADAALSFASGPVASGGGQAS